MRKYRKFNEGGSSDLEDFEDKAMPKRVSALDDLASGADKGSFDEDVYARAKRFVDRGGNEAPKAAAKPKAKTVPPSGTPGGAYRGQRSEMPTRAASAEIPKPAASQGSRAVIPGGGRETEIEEPTPASRAREGMSDTAKKALMASGPLSMIGLGVGYKAYKASDAAKRAQIAKAIREGAESAPVTGGSTAARTTSETGRRFGPKAEMEAAESTMRGAVGRKDIQAKRAAKERAESAERKSSGRTGSTGAPRSRNTVGRDEEMTSRNFASGGKVRGGGCEMRGKTKGRMV
jgi:hypothetical protein